MELGQEFILVIDFGSQYTRLIARRIRELNVYSRVIPYDSPELTAKQLEAWPGLRGVILSGGPASVTAGEAPRFDLDILPGDLPTLGICYGAQLIVHFYGGDVRGVEAREFGRAEVSTTQPDPLLASLPEQAAVWMSHSDSILALPKRFHVLARTPGIAIAAFRHSQRPLFGLQFHPEVAHTPNGPEVLRAFVRDISEARADWTPAAFADASIEELQSELEGKHVICALSGGVDSTVAATLLHRAIGSRLTCLFVDTGLLRKGEYERVLKSYERLGLNVKGIRASQRFLHRLEGVADPEKKRRAIGRLFIKIFEEQARSMHNITHLAQGTIYPDIIESAGSGGPAATIKSHHNVGGLPERMQLTVVEPLRSLFKDEVRRVGRELGVPDYFLKHHPFPGPGLAIRIPGSVTQERVRLLQEADAIFINALEEQGLYDSVWQAFAVLLPVSTVGVMGDQRTYENVVALRAVTSVDGMTADWAQLPHDFLSNVATQIINTVPGVNRVVYDISSKPPATIEWE